MRKELIAVYKEYFASEEHYLKTEKSRLESELAGPKKGTGCNSIASLERRKRSLLPPRIKTRRARSHCTRE